MVHQKWWFSIVLFVYQRVSPENGVYPPVLAHVCTGFRSGKSHHVWPRASNSHITCWSLPRVLVWKFEVTFLFQVCDWITVHWTLVHLATIIRMGFYDSIHNYSNLNHPIHKSSISSLTNTLWQTFRKKKKTMENHHVCCSKLTISMAMLNSYV